MTRLRRLQSSPLRSLLPTPALLALATLVLWGCGGEKEPETARAWFDEYVAPELVRACGGSDCHGVPKAEYEQRDSAWYTLAVDEDGTISSAETLQIAYDESIGNLGEQDPTKFGGVLTALDHAILDRVDTRAPPRFSLLVRKPVPVELGGVPHKGHDNYSSWTDEGLVRILDWIEMEQVDAPSDLDTLEERFGDEILPVLQQRGCMVSACHGLTVANPLKLDPGVGGTFSDEMIRRNRKAALHFIDVNATGQVPDRLLRKALPADLGGIPHRGGNDFFDTLDEPGVQAIASWIAAERDHAGPADRVEKGVIYVQRTAATRDFFDVGAWTPGATLWMKSLAADAGDPEELSARMRARPVDIRTPEVSPDGARVLFAMRTSPTDCLNLYGMDIEGGAPERLTESDGCEEASHGPTHANAANLSPRYGPDGRVYFVSTRGGVLADRGRFPSASIWSMEPDGKDVRQITLSFGHELYPTLSHEGLFIITSLRDIGPKRNASLFTFPPNWYTNYHPHFGNQSSYRIFAQVTELADFREVLTVQAMDGRFQAGALAVLDRNMGPDLEDPADAANAALPSFRRPLNVLTDDAVATGGGAGVLWRDPVALPDGRFIAARSTEAVDPTDEGAVVDFDLVIVELGAEGDLATPTLGSETPLVTGSGTWEIEPAVVRARELPHIRPTYLRDDMPEGTGTALLYDVVTIESLLRDIRSTGRADKVRKDLQAVRVVVGIAPTPEDMAPIDPARVRNGDPASTKVSNGIAGRRFTIGPAPVAADGSLYVRLPARAPVYLQAIDVNGLAAGMHHDRWIFLNEGEPLGFGVAQPTYDQFCGGCHGSYSGDVADAVGSFDLLTSASVTLATHDENEEPIEPIDATNPALFDFASFKADIEPMLQSACATSGCHDAGTAAGSLDLSAEGSETYEGPWSNTYESLMVLGDGSGTEEAGPWRKELVDERGARARSSYLVEHIYGLELDAPRSLSEGDCGATGALDDDQKAKIARWIDLGAAYLGPND